MGESFQLNFELLTDETLNLASEHAGKDPFQVPIVPTSVDAPRIQSGPEKLGLDEIFNKEGPRPIGHIKRNNNGEGWAFTPSDFAGKSSLDESRPGVAFIFHNKKMSFTLSGLPFENIKDLIQNLEEHDPSLITQLVNDHQQEDFQANIYGLFTEELGQAEILADLFFSKRFLYAEENSLGMDSTGPSWWLCLSKETPNEIALYFSTPLSRNYSECLRLGPLGDFLIAQTRIEALVKHLGDQGQSEISIGTGRIPFIILRGGSRELSPMAQGIKTLLIEGVNNLGEISPDNLSLYWEELAYARQFWRHLRVINPQIQARLS